MSRKTGNALSHVTFLCHSAVLSLSAVLLCKVPNMKCMYNDDSKDEVTCNAQMAGCCHIILAPENIAAIPRLGTSPLLGSGFFFSASDWQLLLPV